MFDIITDSACDWTTEKAKQYNVEVVPFYVSLDGEHYRKEGKEIAVRDFYQFMVDNPSAYPKTSLPSLEDFEQIFRRQAEAGRPTLCLCFTSKMSGCVGSARNARELVLEDYPDAKIEVMDSTAATVTESEMVENAVAMRDAGCTLEEAVVWLSAERVTNQIFFTVGNLDYLIKGGRIGKVTGRAANILGIKPMILFKEGEIFSGGMARGRQKSFEVEETSRMEARNTLASWISSLRTFRSSARTLQSTISRRMECSSASSRTECTGTILDSWLHKSSVCWSSVRTSSVRRDRPRSSVGPTARDSMLNPLRENSREIWESTPGSSSTRTEKVRNVVSMMLSSSPQLSRNSVM